MTCIYLRLMYITQNKYEEVANTYEEVANTYKQMDGWWDEWVNKKVYSQLLNSLS